MFTGLFSFNDYSMQKIYVDVSNLPKFVLFKGICSSIETRFSSYKNKISFKHIISDLDYEISGAAGGHG